LKDKLKLWFMPTGWRPADVRHIFRGKLTEADNFRSGRCLRSQPFDFTELVLMSTTVSMA